MELGTPWRESGIINMIINCLNLVVNQQTYFDMCDYAYMWHQSIKLWSTFETCSRPICRMSLVSSPFLRNISIRPYMNSIIKNDLALKG